MKYSPPVSYNTSASGNGRQASGRNRGIMLYPPGTNCLSFTNVCHDRACERHGVALKALTELASIGDPGLSCFTKLSKWQKVNAKTVTTASAGAFFDLRSFL